MNRLVDDGSLFVARPRNQPRFSYPFANFPTPDNYTRMIARGMVVRPQYYQPVTAHRTRWENLLISSSVFDDAAWTPTRASVSAAGTLLPDQTTSWKLIEDNTVGSTHFLAQGPTITAGTYTRYFVVKAGARTRIELSLIGNVSVAQGFDLEAGARFPNTLGMTDPTKSGMIFLVDGWWLCWMTQALTSGVGVQCYLNDGGSVTYDGDGTSGVFIGYDHLIEANRPGPIFITANVPRAIQAPDLDPGDEIREYDPFAFLLEETDPLPDSVGRYAFDRNFGRIPIQQITPGWLAISKPALSGSFPQRLGGYIIFQLDPSTAVYQGYFNYPVASDSGAPTSFYPTSGTYTLSFEGDTTAAIDFDAIAADVETELNLLASVTARGGLTVTGAYNDPDGFAITWNTYGDITFDTTGLSFDEGVILPVVNSLQGGYQQNAGFTLGLTTIPRASFSPTVDLTNLVGYTAGSQSISDVRNGTATFAREQFIIDSSTNITGGTFTITIFGQTTAAIPINSNWGQVATAVNLLSNVVNRGGATVPTGQAFVPILDPGLKQFSFSFDIGQPIIYGGTFTATIFAETTGAIAYNDTPANVQTALNALSEVTARGGATVTTAMSGGASILDVTSRMVNFDLGFENATITGDETSLVPVGSTITPTLENTSGQLQKIVFFGPAASRTITTFDPHGMADDSNIYIEHGTSYFFVRDGSFTIVNATTIQLSIAPTDPYASLGTITNTGRQTKADYQPGSVTVRVSRIKDFYLPGVTLGINTVADIPNVQSQSENSAFLLAIFAGSGTINWAVGNVEQWKGPILSRETTTMQASDL